MRIAELSRRTGVPVPTIKYYRREGLLPPGELSSPNQAQYGDEHLRRIRLIRALVDAGGLPIAAVRDLLAVVDAPAVGVHSTLGAVLHHVLPTRTVPADETWTAVSEELEDLLRERGWEYETGSPALRTAIAALAAMRELAGPDFARRALLEVYADAVERIAAAEIGLIGSRGSSMDTIVEGAVIGTVLGDTMIGALRHLAQESASAKRFGTKQQEEGPPAERMAPADAPPEAHGSGH
jgi:DNA-binding transcriptional MerR regulator